MVDYPSIKLGRATHYLAQGTVLRAHGMRARCGAIVSSANALKTSDPDKVDCIKCLDGMRKDKREAKKEAPK